MGNGLKTHRCTFIGEGLESNEAKEQTLLMLRCKECGQRGSIKVNSYHFPYDKLLKLCE